MKVKPCKHGFFTERFHQLSQNDDDDAFLLLHRWHVLTGLKIICSILLQKKRHWLTLNTFPDPSNRSSKIYHLPSNRSIGWVCIPLKHKNKRVNVKTFLNKIDHRQPYQPWLCCALVTASYLAADAIQSSKCLLNGQLDKDFKIIK